MEWIIIPVAIVITYLFLLGIFVSACSYSLFCKERERECLLSKFKSVCSGSPALVSQEGFEDIAERNGVKIEPHFEGYFRN